MDNLQTIALSTRDPVHHDEPCNTYALYKRVVGPFLSTFSAEIDKAISSSTEPLFRDLFLWAVLMQIATPGTIYMHARALHPLRPWTLIGNDSFKFESPCCHCVLSSDG